MPSARNRRAARGAAYPRASAGSYHHLAARLQLRAGLVRQQLRVLRATTLSRAGSVPRRGGTVAPPSRAWVPSAMKNPTKANARC